MTNKHMTDDEICAEIAKMKSAPWSGWTPWLLIASVLGILQYWVYPTENSTVILSGSVVALAYTVYIQFTLMRVYRHLRTFYENLRSSDSNDA
jgi:hypothetical protein